MATQIQITNRSMEPDRKVTATVRDAHGTETILEFVLRPGEAVIVPLQDGMQIAVLDANIPDNAAPAGSGKSGAGPAELI